MTKMPGPRGVRSTRNRGKVFLVPTTPENLERTPAPHHTSGALALDHATAPAHATSAQRLIVLISQETGMLGPLQQALDHDADVPWSVQTYASAQPALTLIQHDIPSVILLGVDRGPMDEAGYYQQLRSLPHLNLDDSQIIFITSATSHELSASGVTGGVILRTPIAVSEVLELIREALTSCS